MKGKLIKIEGNNVTFELDTPVYLAQLYMTDGYAQAEIYFDDKRFITTEQRKHYYALIGDYAEYTGVPLDAADAYFKYQFMIEMDLGEFPSVGRGRMDKTTASVLLEYLITYFIHHDVPFRKQQFYLTTDASKMIFALTKKRLCVVCGKHNSDIHHVDAIGAGANRKTHDHSKHEFLSLCREHHSESHTLGQQS
ncbi:putative HNHc nuclease, partial [Jeotgalibaca porci]|uniref:putative HNHc nuclease n=1 Tax=Jeotgalibaca porci TaxID=1868793 RepID=UPI00359FF353